MKTYLEVTDDYGLIPVDEEGRKYIYNRKPGDKLSCDIKQARNYKFHKKFFALVKAMFAMQDHFDEPEHFRRWLTMKSGYYTAIVCPNGNTIFQADSIAFDKMEEEDFGKLYSTVIDVFLKELGKGQTEDDLLKIIEFV